MHRLKQSRRTERNELTDPPFVVSFLLFRGKKKLIAMRLRRQIFGPVASVMKFSTEEEVLELANSSIYGLGAGVFTSQDLSLLSFSLRSCPGQRAPITDKQGTRARR